METEIKRKEKEEKQIQKITFHEILWYFIIFSVLGLIIEMLFCYATTRVIESRKGLVWGPFCPIYGIGATLLIVFLNRYQDNPVKLFLFGALVGDIFEYIASYVLETIYKTRFWDYTYCTYQLNGRISLEFTIFWGVLAILLIKLIKPLIDRIINKIPERNRKKIDICISAFLIVDIISSIWAIKIYRDRAERIYYERENQNANHKIEKMGEKLFSNEFMMKTFPNLRYMNEEGEECFIRDIMRGELVKEK